MSTLRPHLARHALRPRALAAPLTSCLAVTLVTLAGTSTAAAQPSAFRYQVDRAAPTGTVWHFVKSNRDGSEPWHLDAYVASPTRLEVVKWVDGGGDYVEVHADLDLATAQPTVLQQWNTTREGGRQPRLWAHLPAEVRELRLEVANGPTLTVPYPAGPFQIWGFDLMGLAVMLPHLAAPGEPFAITFLDPNRLARGPALDGARWTDEEAGGMPLVDVARFVPAGEESRGGVPCRRYRLEGPFFGELAGAIWVSLADGTLVAAEHALRTSTDWSDFRLERTGVETLSGIAWERFKAGLVDRLAAPAAAPAAATP